jgi:predicted DsbA family dithiol-disulfide isomerase
VQWKPFIIDPHTNPNGETVEDYCHRRWGSAGWTGHLKQQGQKHGAYFAHWKWWPHTLRAHQLVQYMHDHNICTTDKVNQQLFVAQYEKGENISHVDTLLKIAKETLGLPPDKESDLEQYLIHDKGKTIVQQEIRQGRQRYGIKGVPFFVIGKQDPHNNDDSSTPYGFSGAQDPETFLDVFTELSSSS